MKKFTNDLIGFKNFTALLEDLSLWNQRVNMGKSLRYFYMKKGIRLVLLIQLKLSFFMKSQLTRNKTDFIDAKQIKIYCELLFPSAWTPESEEIRVLQNLVKRVETLTNILLQEQNRLENSDDMTKSSIDEHVLI